jgi:hypothetical protein
MASRNTQLIVSHLASDIGVDASHFRKERDRLYITGIEIAILIAVGVLTSFLTGLFNGVKKRLNQYGEVLGEQLVDEILGQLTGISDRLAKIDPQESEAAKKDLDEIRSELDTIFNRPELDKLTAAQLQDLRDMACDEVKSYLRRNGFPEATAVDDAQILSDRVIDDWTSSTC